MLCEFLHGRLAFSGVSRVILLVLIGVDVIALATSLTIGPSFESNGHMGFRHESLLPCVNGNPTSQQISPKTTTKQFFRYEGLKRFSDEEWLGLLTLPNCILRETSQSLQKNNSHSHSPRTHCVCFCRKTRLPVSSKTYFDY